VRRVASGTFTRSIISVGSWVRARGYIAASPIASVFAAASSHSQQAVSDEVAERLAPHATADGSLRMPMTSNVAVGTA
jgi:hypothetical protein